MAKKQRARARPETSRICNLEPSHNTENDWRFEHAVAANAIAAPRAAAPASVDLRAAWWDIGNQEATGSCVGWSSTDGVARYHFVKAGRLAAECKAIAALHLDGVEGNRHVHQSAGDVH